ncbi:MAG: endolytic transglycosylase MltG, partial [Alphaproteobacteria bacterium]|nr:endolytic transglycosylase MltG [Alphaproteobacteria bacterium]
MSASDGSQPQGKTPPKPSGSALKRLLWAFAYLFGSLAVATGVGGWWAHSEYQRLGPLADSKIIIIPRGEGLQAIARRLVDNGIIRFPMIFVAAAVATDRGRALKAGEYQFAARISMEDAMALMASGRTVARRVTVPEGLTVTQILQLLDGIEGLEGKVTAAPNEGEILPETYYFSYGDGRDDVVRRMRRAAVDAVAEAWANRKAGLPLANPREALILASIIEKETGRPEERSRIAGVFINRMRLGMPLQSDPTVIYGISDGVGTLGRALTRDDLQAPHPYNTYLHRGLPPGPISNPGRAALAAVLRPLKT